VLDSDRSGKVDYDEFYNLVHSWRVLRRYNFDDEEHLGLTVEFSPGDSKMKSSEDIDSIAGELVHIKREGVGMYRVTWIPRKSGVVHASVRLGESHLKGSPYTVNVKPSASERLYLMNVVLGIEINIKAEKNRGCQILNVRKGGAAGVSGVMKDEYIKDISGVYIADNQVFEECMLTKTPGDKVDVTIVSADGRSSRKMQLLAGAKGHTPQEVAILRVEAEDETPWEDHEVFDRAQFAALHPYIGKRKPTKGGIKKVHKKP
jgi:hypothetical protein